MSIRTRSKRPNNKGESLGQFKRAREVMFHAAKKFYRNPLAALAEQQHKAFDGPQWLPLPGETYNVGRNKAKRERRAA